MTDVLPFKIPPSGSVNVRIMARFEESPFACPVIGTAKKDGRPEQLLEIARKHYPDVEWELVDEGRALYPYSAICYEKGDLEGAVVFCF